MKRAFPVLAAVVAALLAILATGISSPVDAAPARQPDLGMARLSSIRVENTGGRSLLRFSATIVNVGTGAFRLSGTRTSTTSPFSVSQLVDDGSGNYVATPTSADLVFGGDGHLHWHVKDLEDYDLLRLDNGVNVGTSAKSGFCFFDTTAYRLTLPGAPQQPVYRAAGCGGSSAMSVLMGLSIGWGDTYPATLPDQYVDITGLSSGRYRLVATADPRGLFVESTRANNATWVDVQLQFNRNGAKVRVLGYGPAA